MLVDARVETLHAARERASENTRYSLARWLVAASLLCGCDAALQPPGMAAPGLDAIIAQNTVALGGQRALDAVDNMVKHSLIMEGDDAIAAVFAADRDGRMRVDIFAGSSRVFAESYDGQRGHQWRPDQGQAPASEQGTTALSHTPQLPNHVLRLKDLEANGHDLQVVDTEAADERNYVVLRLTLSDGFETFLWFDTDSGRVTRLRNERALHVDVDSERKSIETRVSDFRPVDGIVHPHLAEEVDLATGEVLVRIELRHLEINASLSENYFNDLVSVAAVPMIESARPRQAAFKTPVSLPWRAICPRGSHRPGPRKHATR